MSSCYNGALRVVDNYETSSDFAILKNLRPRQISDFSHDKNIKNTYRILLLVLSFFPFIYLYLIVPDTTA